MRALMLLVLILSVQAVEAERITTTDGRTLVGVYDEDGHFIRVRMGNIDAKIPLAANQIAKREVVAVPAPAVDTRAIALQLQADQREAEIRREIERQAALKAARDSGELAAQEAIKRRKEEQVEKEIAAIEAKEVERKLQEAARVNAARAVRDAQYEEERRAESRAREAKANKADEDKVRAEQDKARAVIESIAAAMEAKKPNRSGMDWIAKTSAEPDGAPKVVTALRELNGSTVAALRAIKPPLTAAWVIAMLQQPDSWGERNRSKSFFLPVRLTDLNATDGGFAFCDKKEGPCDKLVELLKDGKPHLVLLVVPERIPWILSA